MRKPFDGMKDEVTIYVVYTVVSVNIYKKMIIKPIKKNETCQRSSIGENI